MQRIKEIGLVFLVILFTSCSGTGKLKRSIVASANTEADLVELCSEVENNNIGNRGYIIKNGSGSASGMGYSGEFNFNIKRNSKQDFIISVRGPFAIEVVRLIAVNNDIYLINRLEKKIYKGTKSSFTEKYGLPENILEILLGDLSLEGKRSQFNMDDEIALMKIENENYVNNIIIDRNEKKVIKETIKTNQEENEVELSFGKFRTDQNFKFPSEVRIIENSKDLNIVLRIENIKTGIDEELDVQLPDYKIVSL